MEPYKPWFLESAVKLLNIPSHKVKLGNFPTPLHPWSFSFQGKTYNFLIKRDDLTDLAASGNKIRKLEFILPEVLRGQHDWIVSLGPTQSNCCRVVSAIAPRLGLRSAHVLVKNLECQPSQGNLFFHSLFGSKLFFISRDHYLQHGQQKLLEEAKETLMKEEGASNPYILPMGGSTVHGIFGYIDCFHELEGQLEELKGAPVDEIFFACGNGGIAAGLVIGKLLSNSSYLKDVKLTGYIAWDEKPAYFLNYVNEMLTLVGLRGECKAEDVIRFETAKNLGYGINSGEEIELIKCVARSSGIILDGSYTVKAVGSFIKEKRHEGKVCIFLHTGGMFSMMGSGHIFD